MRRKVQDANMRRFRGPFFSESLDRLIGQVVDLPLSTYRYGSSGLMDHIPYNEPSTTSDGHMWQVCIKLRDRSGGGEVLILIPDEASQRAAAYYHDKEVTVGAAHWMMTALVEMFLPEE